MRLLATASLLLVFGLLNSAFSQAKIASKSNINNSEIPNYVKFSDDSKLIPDNFINWLKTNYSISEEIGYKIISEQKDQNSIKHCRCVLTIEGIPLHDGMFILHTQNNNIYAFNGNFQKKYLISNTQSFSSENAMQKAIEYVNADVYKWDLESEERFIKKFTENDKATYYPVAEPYLIPNPENEKQYIYTYKFNIYAHKPLKRLAIFVDAQTGKVVKQLELLHSANIEGEAVTRYSGIQTIITDSLNGSYVLRETTRGQGIETYNMQMGIDYEAAIDFTDDDNNWNNTNAEFDEVATDAHWATEKTYDYYYQNHGRNSIDDSGLKLRSYVHFDLVEYGYPSNVNAFWDGEKMTYGDGGGSITPLTTVDICGHEITHGLTSYTCNLDYQDESGAMNEAFSDIFGTAIEFFAKPADSNWLIGEDIGSVFRSIENPKDQGNPDTYLGEYWVSDGSDYGGVHSNGMVYCHWFYLTSVGGSGTNDNGDSYNISGIGIEKAAQIAFRTQTVYLTNTSDYSDARFYTILSAIDLFGSCSSEVETITNALYAVGVGEAYVPFTLADFEAPYTNFCNAPSSIYFNNNSINGLNFSWDFGDGTTSTEVAPTHTYNDFGTFTVLLIADGDVCGIDSVTKENFISIDISNPCIEIMPLSGSGTTNICSGTLLDSGGDDVYQNDTYITYTIAPTNASSLLLTFESFDFESGYDYLYIYDGPNTSSTLIGTYDGSSLPNGGSIVTSTGAVTLVQSTDPGVIGNGFEMNWACFYPNDPPICQFDASSTESCDGIIQFTDLSLNIPIAWFWDFGDGQTSSEQNPTHTYLTNGIFDVQLIIVNASAADTLTKSAFITVNKPDDPIIVEDERCGTGYVNLIAWGPETVRWYDQQTSGNMLYEGVTFTPEVSETTTFYAENGIYAEQLSTGKLDNTGDGAYFGNPSYIHYLVFDAYVPFKLQSVKVYADGAGTRNIALRNSAMEIIQSVNVYIPDGESQVLLNIDVPVGTDLQLVGLDSPNLYRNSAGVSFPYELSGIMSITKSSASTAPYDYYYYFYDWKIKELDCVSNRIPVVATVIPFEMPFDLDTIHTYLPYMLDAGLGYESYLWFDGSTSQSVQINDFGWVWLTVSGDNSCTETDSVFIDVPTGIENNFSSSTFSIYPNPSNGTFSISLENKTTENANYKIYSSIGQLVAHGELKSNTQTIRLENKGIYFVQILDNENIFSRKIVIK